MKKHAIAYIDGSGNSASIQACAVTMNIGGIVYEKTSPLPPNTTNNVGEYSGLLLALNYAALLDVKVLQIRSDSQLIVNQMLEKWPVKSDLLKPYHAAARKAAEKFDSITISWIPREQNKRADKLCRETRDKAMANPFIRKALGCSLPSP
jgi:ribonuclease HI